MLVRIARQSHLGDPEGCATILGLLATSRLLHDHLQGVLSELGLSEIKLTTLVGLYAVDPEPATTADLAANSQISRATLSGVVTTLRARGWIIREAAPSNRRLRHIRLTDKGRAIVEKAVRPFLDAVNKCALVLTSEERDAATHLCTRLNAHFQ